MMSEATRSMSGLTGPSKSSGETSSETHEFDLGAIFPVLSTRVLRSRYVDVAPGAPCGSTAMRAPPPSTSS